MTPSYSAINQTILYNTSETDAALYQPGESLSITVPGGNRFFSFTLSLDSPSALEGFNQSALNAVLEQTQGGDVAEIRWLPDDQAQWSLYIGGSRPIFRSTLASRSYIGTEFYVYQALLKNDGRIRLDDLTGLANSSARVLFSKTRSVRKLKGANVLELTMGQSFSASHAEPLSESEPSETDFVLTEPNPAAPVLQDRIAWQNLPESTERGGQLTLTLSASNGAIRQSVVCNILHPEQGSVDWPAELTPFADEEASLTGTLLPRFNEELIELTQDEGSFVKSKSVQINLAL